MYIWFNKQGAPVEIVTTRPARVGNSGVNTFNLFFDFDVQPEVVDYTIRWADGSTTAQLFMDKADFVFSKRLTSLGPKRDTKYFADGAMYSGFTSTLPETVPVSGGARISIRSMDAPGNVLAEAAIGFDVEDGIISGGVENYTQLEALEAMIAQLPYPSPQMIDGDPTDPDVEIVPKKGLVAINKNTYEMWKYVGNQWVSQGILKGPKGDVGPQGPQGPQGTLPTFYIDQSTGHLMAKQSDNPVFELRDDGHLYAVYH